MSDMPTPEQKSRAYEAFRKIWPEYARGYVDFDPEDGGALHIFDHVAQPDGSTHTLKGYTEFFRSPALTHALLDTLGERGAGKRDEGMVRILDAPASIGATAYSLAAFGVREQFNRKGGFEIDTFDISETFTQIAREAVYPWASLWGKNHQLYPALTQDAFSERVLAFFRIRPDVTAHVNILPAQPFEDFAPQKRYDAVIVNNLFMYFSDAQIRKSMRVVEQTDCDLFVCLHGEPRPGHSLMDRFMPESFSPVAQHPQWADSPISRLVRERPWFAAYARNGAGMP